MSNATVLNDSEKQNIKSDLIEMKQLGDVDLTKYVTELDVSDGEAEVRFFPTPEQGPSEGVYFEVTVDKNAHWYDDSVAVYGPGNLENGNGYYQAFSQELKQVVQDALGKTPEFVQSKGGKAFTAEVTF